MLFESITHRRHHHVDIVVLFICTETQHGGDTRNTDAVDCPVILAVLFVQVGKVQGQVAFEPVGAAQPKAGQFRFQVRIILRIRKVGITLVARVNDLSPKIEFFRYSSPLDPRSMTMSAVMDWVTLPLNPGTWISKLKFVTLSHQVKPSRFGTLL